ncbi:unnamed protein product [Clavelina lepadiformis]|uniref:Uncharacterized protein n=1 Tax=Clavelina lepadiformis TaxID=159417 RepID=A0ABP0G409_CLALP
MSGGSNGIEMDTFTQAQDQVTQQDGSEQIKDGQIHFDHDEDPAKYAIVSNESGPNLLNDLLIKKWKMNKPNIIISITGGAKNFNLKSSQKKELRKSLVKAAVDTGGWIISGGTHTGVMELVGEAVHEHMVAKDSYVKATVLGIATFGVLQFQNDLKDYSQKKKSFYYEVQHKPEKLVYLDKHHSHFILVGDHKEKSKFGEEIELRARLERDVAHWNSSSRKVPVVCILIQGGKGSLKTVHDALQEQTPVVIVADTGGWANILSRLCDEPFNAVNESLIANLLTEEGIAYKSAQLGEWTNWARECLMQKRLITIFSLDENNSVANLDIAILQAILKEDQSTTKQNLQLALNWNRCDIARNDILNDEEERKMNDEDKWKFFEQALQKDQTGFIDLFLDYGWNMDDFFNKKKLNSLNKKDILKSQTLLVLYGKYKDYNRVYNALLGIKPPSSENNENYNREQALRELFKWAVMDNRQETARLLWNAMSKEELAAAVVAHKLLTRLAEKSSQSEQEAQYNAHADTYQKLATGILSKFLEGNSKSAILSVTRILENWGDVTILQLAASSNAKDFMSHRAVQSHLEDIWYGIVRKTANGFWSTIFFWLHIIFCVLFPLFVPTLNLKPLEDRCLEERLQKRTSGATIEEADSADETQPMNGKTPLSKQNQEKSSIKEFLTKMWKDIWSFYKAPFVKFLCNVFFYVMFLLLFAIALLSCTGVKQNNLQYCSVILYILVGWVAVLAMDEVRQIIHMPASTAKLKMWFWIRRSDNQLDLASFLFFAVGFALFKKSLSNHDFCLPARILLAISFIIYCLRVFSLFAVHADLGPKLLMVTKMLKDLLFFLFIWAVIFFAYGVASQALLYPDEKNAKNIFVGSVYKPYWQLFGELFLSEINYNPDADEFTCSNANVTDNDTDTRMPHCPQENAFVPILSAIYMLLVNVLLLNLLIAMFSYTFEKLVDKTDVIWKFERYYLVEEYYFRPCLVVPFSIISYIISIIRWILEKNKTNKRSKDNKFAKHIKEKELIRLLTWEHSRTDSYLEDKRIEEENETSTRLEKLAIKLESVEKKLERQEKLAQTSRVTSALRSAKEVHVRARTPEYPRTDVERFKMEDYMVPWNVPYDDYKPTSYTSDNVMNKSDWADNELSDDTMGNIRFNVYDGKNKVDRTSYEGLYMVVKGLPRNPRGRTGLTGRGLLGRYGPNHFAAWAFTRWKKNGEGDVKGKRVIEFISIKRNDWSKKWAIPGGMVKRGKNVANTWARDFIKKLLEKSSGNIKRDYFLNFAWIEVFKGYSDDSRNTDNAWIETSVCNFHDEHNSIFGEGPLEYPNEEVEWKEVGASMDLFEDHESFIKKVAAFRKACVE